MTCEAEPGRPAARGHDPARLVVLAVASSCGLTVLVGGSAWLPLLLALGAAGAVVAVLLQGRWLLTGPVADPSLWARLVVGWGLVASGATAAAELGPRTWGAWLLVAPYLVAGVLACCWTGARGRAAFAATLGAFAVLATWVLLRDETVIDVGVYLRDAAADLRAGRSPYGGSVPNPYGPLATERFLAPELVEGDRITIGFPYLPAPALLAALPAAVVDVRLVHLACLLAVAVVARRVAVDEAGRILALVPLTAPWVLPVLANYWVEPVVMVGLALLVLGLAAERRRTGLAGLVLLLLTKQYLLVAAPTLLGLARRWGAGPVGAAAAVAALVLTAFAAWDPAGFWRDVVLVHVLQPFRPDSISLAASLASAEGPPTWTDGPVPLLAGLAVSALLALRAGCTPAVTAAGVGLALMVTSLLFKQAFVNYYAVVEVALVLAVVSWPRDQPGAGDDEGPG